MTVEEISEKITRLNKENDAKYSLGKSHVQLRINTDKTIVAGRARHFVRAGLCVRAAAGRGLPALPDAGRARSPLRAAALPGRSF